MKPTNTTTPAAPATLEGQIDYAIQGCADEGIEIIASNAAELLASIYDKESAAQQLEELTRLVRLAVTEVEEGEVE